MQNNTTSNKMQTKQIIKLLLASFVFISLFFFLPEAFSYEARVMTAIVCFGVLLWALEPIPIGLTALLIFVLMILFHGRNTSVVFSGFASPAIHLIVGGMMLAAAVNETPLIRRMTYKILKKWGHSSKGLVGSLLIIIQIQALFIPATAVRTSLMLPVTKMITKSVNARPGSNLEKLLLLTVAFGGNISGTAIMTAAIGNILTVELLYKYASIKITYFEWFLYTFPLWLLFIPSLWYLLLKLFPLQKEERSFPKLKEEMEGKEEGLGSVNRNEIRCVLILCFTVLLWLTEPIHHLHPSGPALIGVVLMALPGIGCAKWENVVNINYNTVLLLGVTLSMGYAFVDSGAASLISNYLSVDWLLRLLTNPVYGIIFIIIFTQLFHKLISNVSTAVVTLLPIVISLASDAQVDAGTFGLAAGITSLYGFILVVETMPNLLIHSTGMIKQSDFLRAGFYTTLLSIGLTIIVALTWWRFIGLL